MSKSKQRLHSPPMDFGRIISLALNLVTEKESASAVKGEKKATQTYSEVDEVEVKKTSS